MPRRKDRLPVVLDTNVLIAFHLNTNLQSANSKVYRLWRNKRKLQLVVSDGGGVLRGITAARNLRRIVPQVAAKIRCSAHHHTGQAGFTSDIEPRSR